jgi:hypothetical protein
MDRDRQFRARTVQYDPRVRIAWLAADRMEADTGVVGTVTHTAAAAPAVLALGRNGMAHRAEVIANHACHLRRVKETADTPQDAPAVATAAAGTVPADLAAAIPAGALDPLKADIPAVGTPAVVADTPAVDTPAVVVAVDTLAVAADKVVVDRAASCNLLSGNAAQPGGVF